MHMISMSTVIKRFFQAKQCSRHIFTLAQYFSHLAYFFDLLLVKCTAVTPCFFFQPSIHYLYYLSIVGHGKAGANLSWFWVRGRPHTEQVANGITKRQTTIQSHGQFREVDLIGMALACRRKPDVPEETHRGMGRMCKVCTERFQLPGRFEAGTHLLCGNSANYCTGVLPSLDPYLEQSFYCPINVLH